MIYQIKNRLRSFSESYASRTTLWLVVFAFVALSLICPVPLVAMDGHISGSMAGTNCEHTGEHGSGCGTSIGHHVSVWLTTFSGTQSTADFLSLVILFFAVVAFGYLRNNSTTTSRPPDPVPRVIMSAHITHKVRDPFIAALSAGIIQPQLYNV